MTEKLKSCPFCGGTAEIIEEGTGFNIKCADCYAEMTPFATDKRDAIKMWNDRPIEDNNVKYEQTSYSCRACKNATDKEIARLRGNIEAIKKIVDKPPLSIYDAARIYAECCDALKVGAE